MYWQMALRKPPRKSAKAPAEYAMHIGGEEIAAHDSRGGLNFAIGYGAEPTPGRHTQGGEGPFPPGVLIEYPGFDRKSAKNRGPYHKRGASICEVYNAAGVCMIVFGDGYGNIDLFVEAMRTVTGWDITLEELLKTGERIYNIRLAFNAREGLKTPFQFPDRMLGIPPKEVGPRKGATLDKNEIFTEYLEAMGVDLASGKPGKARLEELGMADVAKALWK